MRATLIEKDLSPANGHRAILIAGPTASGKSALAIELAERWNGVVINADSMQLYRELSIVTARPSGGEMDRVPHRLYGSMAANVQFSTGEWLRLISGELDEVHAEGKVPVLVGGTGLYFKALTQGFAEIPEIDPDIRLACRQIADDGGVEAVRAALMPLDPEAADNLADLQRLTRAFEVVCSTGQTIGTWQRQAHGAPLIPAKQAKCVVLAPPRPWLHERIALRANTMLSKAGIEEVRKLLTLDLPTSLPVMRAIGVKEIAEYLAAGIDLPEAERRLTVATRQYAKRQETWFRNQMADWQRLDPSCGDSHDLVNQLNARWKSA